MLSFSISSTHIFVLKSKGESKQRKIKTKRNVLLLLSRIQFNSTKAENQRQAQKERTKRRRAGRKTSLIVEEEDGGAMRQRWRSDALDEGQPHSREQRVPQLHPLPLLHLTSLSLLLLLFFLPFLICLPLISQLLFPLEQRTLE